MMEWDTRRVDPHGCICRRYTLRHPTRIVAICRQNIGRNQRHGRRATFTEADKKERGIDLARDVGFAMKSSSMLHSLLLVSSD